MDEHREEARDVPAALDRFARQRDPRVRKVRRNMRLVDRLARECGRAGVPFAVVARPGTTPARVLQIVGFGPPLVTPDLAAGLEAVRDPA